MFTLQKMVIYMMVLLNLDKNLKDYIIKLLNSKKREIVY